MLTGGEFALYDSDGNERWIKNTFTKAGVIAMLKSSFWRSGATWHVGLCANPPTESLALIDLVEPDNTNGYARVALPFTSENWPIVDELVGQVYIRSKAILFDLTGPLSVGVNRLFIANATDVIAISTPLEQARQGPVVLNTPLTTNYRFFIR